jgi:hypothetical protein
VFTVGASHERVADPGTGVGAVGLAGAEVGATEFCVFKGTAPPPQAAREAITPHNGIHRLENLILSPR